MFSFGWRTLQPSFLLVLMKFAPDPAATPQKFPTPGAKLL